MKTYPRIASELYNQPWFIHPAKMAEIEAVFVARMEGRVNLTNEELERIAAGNAPPQHQVGQDIAVIPVAGTISHKPSLFQRASGGTSTVDMLRQYEAALADDGVGTIVFEHQSGGGTVFGTPEAADYIYQHRSEKRTIAHINAYSFSASYYLAAACGEVSITPSGETGSIGVVCAHQDQSGWEEKTGLKTTIIAVPEKKFEGHPYSPLPEDVAAEMMAKCTACYDQFAADVARFRGVSEETVRNDFGRGGTFLAKEAKERGLVDNIETFNQMVDRIRASAKPRYGNRNRLALAEADGR